MNFIKICQKSFLYPNEQNGTLKLVKQARKWKFSSPWPTFTSLWDRLDKRETLYTMNFIKICQKSFLYIKWTKWNTITCETSTKMEIFKSNGSFCNFYLNLPKTSFIHKMTKNKAHTWNEHILNNRIGNLQVKSTFS